MLLKLPWQQAKPHRKSKTLRDLSAVVTAHANGQSGDETLQGAQILQVNNVETEELGPLAKLPPFRPVVIRLLRLFDRTDVQIDEVAALVEADPTLASEVLAVANSALFAIQQNVVQPAHAIALLGVDRTKSLAATLAVRSLMQGGPRPAVVRRFWLHSIATATIARQFAPAFQIQPELSYVAALMHDLGRNGLLAAYGQPYASLALAAYGSTAEILVAEQAAFGMTHCQAGARLAKAWSLPAPLEEAAGHHHDPASDLPMAALVRFCCRLADDLMYQSIHRCDIQKPEETIGECAPERLQSSLIAELNAAGPAVDAAIKALDF